jgi:hypothetical protein
VKTKKTTRVPKSRLVLWTVLGSFVAVGSSLDPTIVAIMKPAIEEILRMLMATL